MVSFFFNFLKDETREKRDNCEGVLLCLRILLSALLSNALLNITSSSVQVQKRLGSTTDSRRVLIVVTISFRRMKTAVALTTKEEADEEKRRQRKTQNERKTRTIQIFYFLRDGCRDTSITTIIRSIFRLERVEINLLGFFLLLFQVKLFVGHDSFYAMMRVIFCRLSQKRGELEKKRTSLSV